MHIRTTGLGAHDLDLELPGAVFCNGATGSGKSTIANAIRFAALGFIPHLGKREQDTAALLNGREATVALTLPEGRVITRTLKTKPKGGFSVQTQCSWLDASAGDEEHAAAAVRLFGADTTAAAEALDLRELLALTGPQRLARVEALLQGGGDAKQRAERLGRYTLQRLADVPDARMPDDHQALRPLIDGYDSTEASAHTGQYGALRELWPMIKAKLTEGGVAGGQGWVNGEKRAAALLVRNKQQAKEELAARLLDLPTPDPDEIARLETTRSALEQGIGAAGERASQAESRRAEISAADAALSTARQRLDQAEAARRDSETQLADLPAIAAQIDTLEEALAAVGTPAPQASPVVDPAIESLREQIAALERRREAIAMPTVPTTFTEQATVDRLNARLAEAHKNPWAAVRAKATEIRTLSGRIPKAKAISVLADELQALAAGQADDPASLRAEIETAEAALDAAWKASGAAEKALSRAVASRAELLQQITQALEQLRVAETDAAAAASSAQQGASAQRATISRELTTLRTRKTGLERTDRDTAGAVAAARTALDAAERIRGSLGAAPAAIDDDLVGAADELADVRARIGELVDLEARRREHAAIVAEIEALTARHVVLVAVEDGLKRLRADEVAEQGGPLLAYLQRILKAAGRDETPYIKADRLSCDFGWERKVAKGNDVTIKPISIAGMSGGEFALFTAALVAGLVILRGAPVQAVVVEGAEADPTTLTQILAGLGAVSDRLDLALVISAHRPALVPENWVAIAPTGEALNLAEAA